MLKGAIFDFDGTLFDSMFLWDTAGETYLRSIGIGPESNLHEILKPMSLHQSAQYIRNQYHIPLPIEEIINGINRTVEDFYFHTVGPKAGVIDFLEELQRRNIKMCIATATDRYLVEAALKRCRMERFFAGIFTCTEIGYGKDKPVIFQRAMAHLHTTKANTVVFEDAYHAAKTAKSDGFITVAVFDSHEKKQAELRSISDCYIESFTQTEHFLSLLADYDRKFQAVDWGHHLIPRYKTMLKTKGAEKR